MCVCVCGVWGVGWGGGGGGGGDGEVMVGISSDKTTKQPGTPPNFTAHCLLPSLVFGITGVIEYKDLLVASCSHSSPSCSRRGVR